MGKLPRLGAASPSTAAGRSGWGAVHPTGIHMCNTCRVVRLVKWREYMGKVNGKLAGLSGRVASAECKPTGLVEWFCTLPPCW